MGSTDSVNRLIGWILRRATESDDLGALLTGVSEGLIAAGVPVWRASIDIPTLDPSSRAVAHKWWRDQSGSVETLPHGPGQEALFQRSVVYHVLSRGLEGRRWRLERGEGVDEFDLLQSLRSVGGTDYLMRLVGFGDGTSALRGVALSVATDRGGGFVRREIALLNRLIPALGLAAYRVSVARTASDALSVYLGANTARRVLAGEIRRGAGQTIAAAIFHADLRRFTALSEREDALKVVAWLDEHFEAIGDAVTRRGGEILKFLGDGLLAVFPVADEGGPSAVCDAALRAAEEAVAANRALNLRRASRGEPGLDVDVALHFGEVVYGNVGATRRLDFTVIGRAVNETCRMESLCERVGRDIVLSQAFAGCCSVPTVALGAFPLRGIDGDRVIYAVR